MRFCRLSSCWVISQVDTFLPSTAGVSRCASAACRAAASSRKLILSCNRQLETVDMLLPLVELLGHLSCCYFLAWCLSMCFCRLSSCWVISQADTFLHRPGVCRCASAACRAAV